LKTYNTIMVEKQVPGGIITLKMHKAPFGPSSWPRAFPAATRHEAFE